MGNISVKVDGLTAALKYFEDYIPKKRKSLLGVVANASMNINADAKIMSPIDTGFLRSEISHNVKENKSEITGTITSGAFYSIFLEYGTVNQRAQPYMVPALLQNKEKFIKEVINVVNST